MEEYRKIFINNLDKYMRLNEISQTDLSIKLGVNKSVVSSWLSGSRYPRMNTMERIATIFHVEKSDLIEKKDTVAKAPRMPVKIPILGSVVAGIPLDAIEDIIGYEEITPEMAAQGDYFALRIKGASMEPVLTEGDVVIVKKQSYCDSGDIAIVLVNGNEATVKKVTYSDAGITLIGYNAAVYPPRLYTPQEVQNLPVQIIGRVIESRRRF